MATARCTANVAVQALFAVPLHMKAIIDAINIDNEGASGAITVQMEDDFTQDISQTNNTPTARHAFPFQATVPAGISFSADILSTESIECLGNVGIICSAGVGFVADAGCVIIVTYHFE